MKRLLLGLVGLSLLTGSVVASPVSVHGALKCQGAKIVGSTSGLAVQVAGPSLYWTIWGGEKFYNSNVVTSVASNWNASLIRAAIAVEYTGGYLESPTQQLAYAKTIVDAAVANGIYVLVDWHDHNANLHVTQAKEFFNEMAKTYATTPNVIWEIWNEPDNASGSGTSGYDTWDDIRAYADSIIPVIRAYSSNLIVVGTPNWSSDPLSAANNPLADSNVAYTLHFYAGTHGATIRDAAETAMSKGAALFITEFGTTDAAGGKTDSTLYFDAANTWLDWADNKGISWANWSLSNIDEPCSIFEPTADASGTWDSTVISLSGKWLKARLLARPSAADTDSVSILVTTSGSGTVAVDPEQLRVKKGTSVTFTATPADGWAFKSWSSGSTATDNPLTLTLTENISLIANFTPGDGTNMISNGDFSDSSDSWIHYVDTSNTAEISFANGQVSVTITKADTINWHIQAGQKNLTLDSGATYTVSLDAWSSGERAFFVGLSADVTWHYEGGSSLTLTDTKKTYTFDITPDSSTDAGILQFNFGKSTLPVYVDNVVMYKKTSSAIRNEAASLHGVASGMINYSRVNSRIYWRAAAKDARVVLTDMKGRVVAVSSISPLDMSRVSAGAYLVVLTDGVRKQSCYIVK